MLRPIVERKLLERQLARAGEGKTMGLLPKPNASAMAPKEVIELYLKLRREEE